MTVIIILALLALLLGAAELFIIPGFGLAGIGAIICAIVDAFLIYNTYGAIPCLVAVLVGLMVLFLPFPPVAAFSAAMDGMLPTAAVAVVISVAFRNVLLFMSIRIVFVLFLF